MEISIEWSDGLDIHTKHIDKDALKTAPVTTVNFFFKNQPATMSQTYFNGLRVNVTKLAMGTHYAINQTSVDRVRVHDKSGRLDLSVAQFTQKYTGITLK